MRLIRKIRYVWFMICVVCVGRLTLQMYCTSVYGVESSITGCILKNAGLHSTSFNDNYKERQISGRVPAYIFQDGNLKVETEQVEDNKREHITGMHNGDSRNRTEHLKRNNCLKRILFWSRETLEKVSKFSKDVLCKKLSCNVKFIISMNWTDFHDSDAVIFHHKVHKDWKELMRRRPRGQIWIFYTRESPFHISESNNFPQNISENVHNWTKVYLSGSDLPTIYGRFIRKSIDKSKEVRTNFAANKTKLCSWIASNCKITSWNRLGFVQALQKYMPIDMYGKCGDLNCSNDCLDILSQYKFYLALESNTCREYITEKVWRNSLLQNVVPVVYGAPKGDYEKLLPPNSFIHVEDFKSFRELANYLREVDEDDDKYNSYFSWKRRGAIVRQTGSSVFTHSSVCDIVQKLLDVEDGVKVKLPILPKRNIKDWWEGSCFSVDKDMVYR